MKHCLEQEIIHIFFLHTGIDFNIQTDLKDAHFFGKKLNFAPRDLLLIFMDLQKTLNIKIPNNILLDKKFTTYNNVINILQTTCELPLK